MLTITYDISCHVKFMHIAKHIHIIFSHESHDQAVHDIVHFILMTLVLVDSFHKNKLTS